MVCVLVRSVASSPEELPDIFFTGPQYDVKDASNTMSNIGHITWHRNQTFVNVFVCARVGMSALSLSLRLDAANIDVNKTMRPIRHVV